IDTTLVSIPVSVIERDGRFIPFLDKKDFRLYEDDVEQEISEFTPVTVPLHVVLLIDTSRSTVFKIEDIQAAAAAFTEQLRADDKVMVVSFDSKVYIGCEFTNDRATLRRAIYKTRTGGGTKLYDAVDLVIAERLNQVQGRKAIVLFTDGVDTESREATARGTVEQVEESDVVVYPIKYDTSDSMMQNGGGRNGTPPISIPWPQPRGGGNGGNGRRPWPFVFHSGAQLFHNLSDAFPQGISQAFPQQWPNPGGGRFPRGGGQDYELAGRYLQQLATRSGGRLHNGDTLSNVQAAFTRIAEELRHQYALSYYPTNTAQDGSFRKVRVVVKVPNAVVRCREGYRARGQGTTAASDKDGNRPVLKRRQLTDTN
ncbi:MAG: VWA domain-containing protein, partial [Acidobacteria bacterium]|nr:VWA domain-containing protein [Acidobacteriota bacterium]